ncbi:hypothetical protein B0H16DRAFT_1468677 [Mycena metata]|uniref:Uncharacterized protein n=1 Tax=Mycena metata TaxID=1033252 RepID=A0AAD7I011_9AGAR|nr:hypothetical protein B0H16DRAFT_1468677 [Mycena metata]
MTSTGTRTEAARILANATRKFPDTVSMTEALTQLLCHWNLEWEKDCVESLKPEHISLRLLGNVVIQPHSTIATLGDFFDVHDRSARPQTTISRHLPPFIFVHTEKKNRKRKAKTVVNEDGEETEVLFDVMTHTLNGSSGVGDMERLESRISSRSTFVYSVVSISGPLVLKRDGFESSNTSQEDSEDDN